ncbi:MAG: aminoacyl-tRNA deacylase [Treponema sp. CETP13]|nr:MAG: aminoacyl-tRNA deacylase [Treponema sp. CETP13]
MSIKKTNAMRILDKLNIIYEVIEYDDNIEHKLELGAAERVAGKVGVNPGQVFKTIVMKADTNEILVFCQNALHKINLKKARSVAGVKTLESVKPENLQCITGYIRGGCSPIGMRKLYRTFIDNSASNYDAIFISGGRRGIQIKLNPNDLISVVDAEFCDLILE